MACFKITMAMYQLHIYLTVNAPLTLNATGTRNFGVISILGVGITSSRTVHTTVSGFWCEPNTLHVPARVKFPDCT